MVSCMGWDFGSLDLVHDFGAHAHEKEETVSHEECINTASLHCSCSSVDSSLSESLSESHSDFSYHCAL